MTTIERVPARQYRAAPGARFGHEDAARYGRFLERKAGLGENLVPPERIIELAQPDDSPLHDQFTWDDSHAAHRWRIVEARTLVSHLVYAKEVDGEEVMVRAFHNVTIRNGHRQRGYVSDRVVWKRPDLAEQVVTKAIRELEGWRDRYRAYSELAGVVAKVEEVLDEA